MTTYGLKEIILQATQDLNDLIDKLMENEPFWGHGQKYEFAMYTTRQILEMIEPLAKTLSEDHE